MPLAPPRTCIEQPCPNYAVKNGRCELHAKTHHRAEALQRGTTAERGYDNRWKRLQAIVRREEPLCRECTKQGFFDRSATTRLIDHILPIDIRPDLRLSRPNLQGLCLRHHGIKTYNERKGIYQVPVTITIEELEAYGR